MIRLTQQWVEGGLFLLMLCERGICSSMKWKAAEECLVLRSSWLLQPPMDFGEFGEWCVSPSLLGVPTYRNIV